ncbi:MAG: N-acetylmuramic acid 6-phosphate etherase [Clostridia bacterium]|nr:N-acetylmuramic acid 6-phosphate etherase [Clostridia bacterium]
MAVYETLITEAVNENSVNINKMNSAEIAKLINNEDKTVAFAVEKALPQIAEGIEIIANSLKVGGHIFYCGAGFSGRLGLLDSIDCADVFGVDPDVVTALIAGGRDAVYSTPEFAEDDPEIFAKELRRHHFEAKDVVIGSSASGTANCVKGAFKYAKECGAYTISITCNKDSEIEALADIAIVAEVGPEVIAGYTSLKAGTAQKMILNTLSTGAMIRYGRVRKNLMTYMVPSSKKLMDRAIRMICTETGCDREKATFELIKADNCVAHAIEAINEE